jgi:hypothetical protein
LDRRVDLPNPAAERMVALPMETHFSLRGEEIDLSAVHAELVELDKQIREATAKHNEFLKELKLQPLP